MARETPDTSGFHGTFRQSMSWLHTWVSLVLGVLLYFIFVTGTAGFAKLEITRWMEPERGVQTDASLPHSSMTMIEAGVAAAMEGQPGSKGIYLDLPTLGREGVRPIGVYADAPPPSEDREAVEPLDILLDPQTLDITEGLTVRETGGGHALYVLHFRLHYIPHKKLTVFDFTLPAWPRLIVGIATMFMLVAIVTGIVVHKKIFADFFTFRPGKGQRSWLDAHNLSSVLALPFMVMITYSGLVFYKYDYMPSVKAAAYGIGDAVDEERVDCELYGEGCNHSHDEFSGEVAPMAPLAPMVARFQEEFPGQEPGNVDLYYPGYREGTVEIYAAENTGITHGVPLVVFEATTGNVLMVEGKTTLGDPPADPVRKVGEVLMALHIGSFAGPMLRWLLLLSGAVGCAMVATGLVLWAKKRRQKLRANERANFGLEFVERSNVGIIVGLLIAVAAYFWANRLLPVGMDDRAEWEIHVMFLTWAATLVHSVLRPASKSWTEQWFFAAAAYALIPILNAVTTDIHLGATIPAGDWALASFDLTMLALGAVFAVCGMKAGSRGEPVATKGHAPNDAVQAAE